MNFWPQNRESLDRDGSSIATDASIRAVQSLLNEKFLGKQRILLNSIASLTLQVLQQFPKDKPTASFLFSYSLSGKSYTNSEFPDYAKPTHVLD
jgi:hypothetical protein